MSFSDKLDAIIKKNNSLACVGLDSDVEKLPLHIKTQQFPQFAFNKAIINTTHALVCAYKPNSAFYEAQGSRGVEELKMTCNYINENYPDIPIILDAKRGDIESTNTGYIKFAFDYLNADAITLHPYLGVDALQPFLQRADKGCMILCRTSNPGAGELQNLSVIASSKVKVLLEGGRMDSFQEDGGMLIPDRIGKPPIESGVHNDVFTEPLYKLIARKVATEWNKNGNCMLVAGATFPEELAEIRKIAGDITILSPGVGDQKGDLEKTVKAGLNSQKKGLIINSSRGIIFASNEDDFAEKAREETEKLKDEINKFR